mmetsp:Transcript_38104/g.113850  ORF Transcript_38104/g.113850 Transcript_38104/m.113850 type:complete len:331 (+) Transcript_38104:825-1817(+)
MAHDGRLRGRPGLEHLCAVVSPLPPPKIDAEVHLGVDRRGGQSLDPPHDGSLHELRQAVDPTEEGQLHDGIPDVAVVETLDEVGREIAEHGPSVGDDEFSSRLGRLEADEGGGAGGAGSDELVVHADEEVLPALLVHGLVHGTPLLPIDGRTCADRMERIEAHLHPHGLVHGLKSLLRLHQVEPPKDDRRAILHPLLDLRRVVPKVRELRVDVALQAEGRGANFRGEFGGFPTAVFRLDPFDVGDFVPPDGEGGEGKFGGGRFREGGDGRVRTGGSRGGAERGAPLGRRGEGRRRRGGGEREEGGGVLGHDYLVSHDHVDFQRFPKNINH